MVTIARLLGMGLSCQPLTRLRLIPGRSFLVIILPVTILVTFHLLRYVFKTVLKKLMVNVEIYMYMSI